MKSWELKPCRRVGYGLGLCWRRCCSNGMTITFPSEVVSGSRTVATCSRFAVASTLSVMRPNRSQLAAFAVQLPLGHFSHFSFEWCFCKTCRCVTSRGGGFFFVVLIFSLFLSFFLSFFCLTVKCHWLELELECNAVLLFRHTTYSGVTRVPTWHPSVYQSICINRYFNNNDRHSFKSVIS